MSSSSLVGVVRGESRIQVALLLCALWAAWRPAETSPLTPVVVAVVILALGTWGWDRTAEAAVRRWLLPGAAVSGCLVLAASCGVAPARGVGVLSLATGVALLTWLSSRRPAPATFPALLALGIALLALWGAWQSVVGLERAHLAAVHDVPVTLQQAYLERIASGRAFASLPLPGHFAVLMATALPLLVGGLRRRGMRSASVVGVALCVLGLVLARSPIGLGLAIAAVAALVVHGGARRARILVGLLLVALVLAVLWRGDVLRLEPLRLRVDNWRTAVWAWGASPAAGVGPGGFAYLAAEAPLDVGNRPTHAHCLPLEWLAELGMPGLVASMVLGGALLRLAGVLWRRRPDMAVAVLVVPAHNLVDFSLFTSGVALPWAVLLGWSLAETRRDVPARQTAAIGRPVAVAALTIIVALTALHATSRVLGRAAERVRTPQERYVLARRSHDIAPWRVPPLATAGSAALEARSAALVEEARDLLRRRRWLAPRSAAWSVLSMRLDVAAGDPEAAVADGWLACHRAGADDDPCADLGRLVEQLETTDARR
jgi:O-antigen ligase